MPASIIANVNFSSSGITPGNAKLILIDTGRNITEGNADEATSDPGKVVYAISKWIKAHRNDLPGSLTRFTAPSGAV